MGTQANGAAVPVPRDGNIFRKTHLHSGRRVAVSPANSSMQHLCYARIRIDAAMPEVTFHTGQRETSFICLGGEAEVTAGQDKFTLGKYDAAYIPRGWDVRVCGQQADLA